MFETAYTTSENLLICAPTGAGKTNIAMMTILRTIEQYAENSRTVKRGEFKIVYVAPMKGIYPDACSVYILGRVDGFCLP